MYANGCSERTHETETLAGHSPVQLFTIAGSKQCVSAVLDYGGTVGPERSRTSVVIRRFFCLSRAISGLALAAAVSVARAHTE